MPVRKVYIVARKRQHVPFPTDIIGKEFVNQVCIFICSTIYFYFIIGVVVIFIIPRNLFSPYQQRCLGKMQTLFTVPSTNQWVIGTDVWHNKEVRSVIVFMENNGYLHNCGMAVIVWATQSATQISIKISIDSPPNQNYCLIRPDTWPELLITVHL